MEAFDRGETITLDALLLKNVSYSKNGQTHVILAGTTIKVDFIENIAFANGDHFLIYEDEYKFFIH